MKKWIVIIGLLLPACASATMTRVQHKIGSGCGTSCAITVASTGTGNVLAVGCLAASSTAGNNCTAVSGGGTWVHPGSCIANSTTANGGTDFWYVLSSTSGTTSVTVTFGASNGGSNAAWFEEISTTATPWTFGACGALSNQAATTSPLSPSISPTGTKNAMFAIVFTAGSISAGSSVSGTGWTTPIVDAPTGDGADDGLDAASGSTQATFTSTSGAYCSSGIWFNDGSSGGASNPGFSKERKLEQMDPG